MTDEADWSCLLCQLSNKHFHSQCRLCEAPRGSKEAPPEVLQGQQPPGDRSTSRDSPAAAGAYSTRERKVSDASSEDSDRYAGASIAMANSRAQELPVALPVRPDVSLRSDSPGDSQDGQEAGSISGEGPAACDEPDKDGMSALDHRLIQVVIAKKSSALAQLVNQGANVNCVCTKHEKAGRTPLFYAVSLDAKLVVQTLVDLDADLQQAMSDGETPLSMAVKNDTYDGTDMVRVLLSLGADPAALPEDLELNLTMQYWVQQAKLFQIDRESTEILRPFRLQHLWRIPFWVVGQRIACRMIRAQVVQYWGHQESSRGKPLVLLLPGPPGHGKTFLSQNLARSLVAEGDWKLISMSDVKEDSNLFGAQISGTYHDGQVNGFLRDRQKRRNILLFDEFEKIENLTSTLGHHQAEKIYNTFISLFQDGALTDTAGGRASGGRTEASGKIDCSQSIFICMCNLGQDEIIKFAQENDRVYERQAEDSDVAWLKQELCKKVLQPLVLAFFRDITPSGKLQAIARRLDSIVPFVPFTKDEQLVVGDSEIRAFLSCYRDPPVLNAKVLDDPSLRMVGNLVVEHTPQVVEMARGQYDPMQGASSLIKFAREEVASLISERWVEGLERKLREHARARGTGREGDKQQRCWVTVVDKEHRCDISFDKPRQHPASPIAHPAPPTGAPPPRGREEGGTGRQVRGVVAEEEALSPSAERVVQEYESFSFGQAT